MNEGSNDWLWGLCLCVMGVVSLFVMFEGWTWL